MRAGLGGCGCGCGQVWVDMGKDGQIWARVGKFGYVWMVQTDWAGMVDMDSGWVWVCVQV